MSSPSPPKMETLVRSPAPLLLLSLLLLSLSGAASASKHTVGGSKGWAPAVNYTDWAFHQRFFVGDWLAFNYAEGGLFDVMQVNSTDYERCSAENPIANYSKGRGYVFQLNNTGDYYFICSRGFCYGGMKLAVHVESIPSPAPAPSPPSRSSSGPAPASRLRRSVSEAVVLAVVGFVFGFPI